MSSQRKLVSVIGAPGRERGERELALIEIDSTFGKLLGLTDGQKVPLYLSMVFVAKFVNEFLQVSISLHLDPPQAHTINIEPLTPADWESE